MRCGECENCKYFGDYSLYYCDRDRRAVEPAEICRYEKESKMKEYTVISNIEVTVIDEGDETKEAYYRDLASEIERLLSEKYPIGRFDTISNKVFVRDLKN